MVEQMIALYCRRVEHNKEMCPSCIELRDYALKRLSHCPFGERKGVCKHCRIHCYRQDMRERIRDVMRRVGPWMLLYHPVAALRHLYISWKNK